MGRRVWLEVSPCRCLPSSIILPPSSPSALLPWASLALLIVVHLLWHNYFFTCSWDVLQDSLPHVCTRHLKEKAGNVLLPLPPYYSRESAFLFSSFLTLWHGRKGVPTLYHSLQWLYCLSYGSVFLHRSSS